jgi:hypothetical protein
MEINKYMECPICFKLYQIKETYAVKLPCFHTICIECVRRYSKSNRITCPSCTKTFKTFENLEKCKTIEAILLSCLGEKTENQESDKVHLLVRNFKGSMLEFTLSPEDSIETLKRKIEEIEGISPKTQLLLCRGKAMQDEDQIKDYHFSQTETVFLVIRTFGG